METKLFSIVLCLLVLEAAGSSLKNLTSIQHGTENASARSISTVGTESAQEMKVPSTQGMKRPSTQESTEGSLKGFPMQDYDRELYERIKGALSNQQPFSFLMMANSYGTRFDYPKAVSNALAKNPVDLDTNGIFPPDAKSNLVIVTNDVSAKIPTSAEEKLVSSMPEMTGYYDTQYIDTTTEKVSCPLIVVLGSTSDTCYTQGNVTKYDTTRARQYICPYCTRKNAQVCYKSVHKLLTGCIRTACYKLLTGFNNLLTTCNNLVEIIRLVQGCSDKSVTCLI